MRQGAAGSGLLDPIQVERMSGPSADRLRWVCPTSRLNFDRWSEFRVRKSALTRARHSMVGSIGRVGAAGDGVPVNAFISLLQTFVLDRQALSTAGTVDSGSRGCCGYSDEPRIVRISIGFAC